MPIDEHNLGPTKLTGEAARRFFAALDPPPTNPVAQASLARGLAMLAELNRTGKARLD